MTEQDLIHKIEWVNKRCSLKGEPLTQIQIELLMFVFADTVVNKNFDLAYVMGSFDHSIIDKIRNSQSDAEARRYIGTHLQNLL